MFFVSVNSITLFTLAVVLFRVFISTFLKEIPSVFLLPARILFSWAIISYVSSSNVSTLTLTLLIVSSESSTICSFLSHVLTMSLFVFFSSTSSVLSFTISVYASLILRLFSSSKSESQPFFLTSLTWSHNRCSVISKTLCSFHRFIIHCLYPLIVLPSSTKDLLLKEHSITILFTFLGHFILTTVGWRAVPPVEPGNTCWAKNISLQVQPYLHRCFQNFDLTFHS